MALATEMFASRLNFLYILESLFRALKSIPNNQSIVLDGLIRKTLRNFTNFIARTKSTKFRNRLKTCFTSKLLTYQKSPFTGLKSIPNNQSIIFDGLVKRRLQN